MNSLNLKMLSDCSTGKTTTRYWPGRLSAGFEATARRQWLNCRDQSRVLRITACASSSGGGGGGSGGGVESQSESSFLSRSQTYALLKQKMEVAAKSEVNFIFCSIKSMRALINQSGDKSHGSLVGPIYMGIAPESFLI